MFAYMYIYVHKCTSTYVYAQISTYLASRKYKYLHALA